MYRKLYLFFIIISLIILSLGCSTVPNNAAEEQGLSEYLTDIKETVTDNSTDYGTMEIFVFDIGKADAILITTENHTVMIDAGENKHGKEIADYILKHDITEIDYLILTHFHKDHIGGAHIIIDNFDVKEIIVPNYGKESKHYERFINAAEKSGLESVVLTDTLKFTLDSVDFTVYPPHSEYYFYGNIAGEYDDDEYDEDLIETDDDEDESITNENNYSLIISVNHGENNFLFTGDAKAKRLREAMRTEEIIFTDYDYLKVPHHGQFNKRSIDFIYNIAPKYAVITCSANRPPDKEILEILKTIGAEIYLTTDGGVYCMSDGRTLIFDLIKLKGKNIDGK